MNRKKNNRDIETKVEKAFSAAVPEIFDTVLADCADVKQERVLSVKTRNHTFFSGAVAGRAAAIAAAVAILFTGGAGYYVYSENYKVASTVSLDVNPAIEITVNKGEKVLHVTPRNEDAERIVGDMKFSGQPLDITVNALIGSMLREGYLNELANSVLISVDSPNAAKGEALREKLTVSVDELLKSDDFEGAVLAQNVTADKELKKLAETYDISPGKAQLVKKLTENNELYTFDDLAGLSVNELNLLAAHTAETSDDLEAVGKASEKAYIGSAQAEKIALDHAGASQKDAAGLSSELDRENGTMVYEVEFVFNGREYEIAVDAQSGEIVDVETEPADDRDDDKNNPNASDSSDKYIRKENAEKLALDHAGLQADEVTKLKVTLSKDDNVKIYAVEFSAGGYEYDYEINALTGEILSDEREKEDDIPASKPTELPETPECISETQAKKLAFEHANVKLSDAAELEIRLDDNDTVYEISFTAGGYEYDYDISAADGTVLNAEKEKRDDLSDRDDTDDDINDDTDDDDHDDDDAKDDDGKKPESVRRIPEAQAKKLAFEHANVKLSDAAELEIRLDDNDTVYEISFTAGGYEYDYDISAADGAVLNAEKEKRDDLSDRDDRDDTDDDDDEDDD